jgi:hypothetical protein
MVKWTAKLPLLVGGLLLLIIGLVATARGRLVIAAIAILLSALFVSYSYTIKDWCEVRTGNAWGVGQWGTHSFGDCAKLKGWWRF